MRSVAFAVAFPAVLMALACTVDRNGSGESSLNSADSGGKASGTAGSAAPGAGGSPASGGGNGSGGHGGGAGTNTGSKACGKIWYNGESGQGDVNLVGADAWSDPSKDPAQGSSKISESMTSPHAGANALKIELNWAAGYYGGAFGFNFAKFNAANAYDVHGAADLELWIRTETGDKTHVFVWLVDVQRKLSNRIDIASSTPVTPQWRKVAVPLTQFTGVDLTAIWEVDADTHADPFGVAGGVNFFIDDGAFTTPGCL